MKQIFALSLHDLVDAHILQQNVVPQGGELNVF